MNEQQPSDITETEADVTPTQAELEALQRAWVESLGPAVVLRRPGRPATTEQDQQ